MVTPRETLVLTRYLYRKHDVVRSLVWALLDNDPRRAQFWAAELTASGFGDETEALTAAHGGPGMEDPTPPPPCSRPWQLMRTRCVYPHDPRVLPVADDIPPYMNMPAVPDMKTHLHQKWLYYASFSPLWNTRIHAFSGRIVHATGDVIFDDADEEEEFWELYNLEPDEQPRHVQMHVWDHAYVLVERATYVPRTRVRVVKVRRAKRSITVDHLPHKAPLLGP